MALAVVDAQCEPNWRLPSTASYLHLPNRKLHKSMGKPSSLGNPNPKNPGKRHMLQPLPHLEIEESPGGGLTHSNGSDDASSINRKPLDGNINYPSYITFKLSNYSKHELIGLKERFTSELDRVRQLKHIIEASTSKTLVGNKRPLPSSNPSKANLKRPILANSTQDEKPSLLKKCGQVLSKLMKHKHSYIFNTPVDVIGLKLHDYHDIIKSPMDLGTVKAKLAKNLYSSPKDFSSDVRLTFHNAMRYNPKGHDVYTLAEQFLARFEEWVKPIEEREMILEMEEEIEPVREVEASSEIPNLEKTPIPQVRIGKLPKPKAKDPNKRDMSIEEKHKLGMELQNLPAEKMEQVVGIIKKRNDNLRQDGDEIELDIEAVDAETLWELDRFITNYKKAVSKMKRQGLIGNGNAAVGTCTGVEVAGDLAGDAKKDEDVDIGDEIPVGAFPPVEIEKDNASESGSSDSGESSSSSGDSSSSSGSDSEDAQS